KRLGVLDKVVWTLRHRLTARMAFLARELASLTPRLSLGTAGVAKLAGWQRRVESGNPVLDYVEDGVRSAFHIQSANAGKGAWFTRVQLDSGRYVFEGKARTMGVIPVASE